MAQKEGQWRRVHSYGGKWAENATQATAREIMEAAKQRVAAAWDPLLRECGYISHEESCVVLSVYDEVVCEVPESFGSLEELAAIMVESAGEWADGWPIKVVPWSGERYKK